MTSLPLSAMRRFSVAEYHQMVQTGILTDEDKVELLEGWVVLKMPRNPPHDGTILAVDKTVSRVLPVGWITRGQSALTTAESEPEPDIVVARGDERSYFTRHATPQDAGLVVEVADSTLSRDRLEKARIYARAAIPIYWIVNLVDLQSEVYSSPSGPSPQPCYLHRQDFLPGDQVPLVLDGQEVARIDVRRLLP